MRVSLSINTFDGPVEEKVIQATKITKSSIHVDYRGDYDLGHFMSHVKADFKNSDLTDILFTVASEEDINKVR